MSSLERNRKHNTDRIFHF